MGRGSGGGGRSGSSMGMATGGVVRQINRANRNTADIVNKALAMGGKADLDSARASLILLGHRDPSAEVVQQYARQSLILGNIERVSGVNASGQIGKWDFTNAQSIHTSFQKYLDRRYGAIKARYPKKPKKR
jgi:hypothetical protein